MPRAASNEGVGRRGGIVARTSSLQSRSHALLFCVLPHGFSRKRETTRSLYIFGTFLTGISVPLDVPSGIFCWKVRFSENQQFPDYRIWLDGTRNHVTNWPRLFQATASCRTVKWPHWQLWNYCLKQSKFYQGKRWVSCKLTCIPFQQLVLIAFYLTKTCIILWQNTPDIWEHSKNVENTSRRRVFSTFHSCSQMPVLFYSSVIHGLGFFIC